MPYIKEICWAGKIIEICKYHAAHYNCKGGKRNSKENPTPESQIKVNLRIASKKLRRLLNANFQDGDFLLTLSYRKENRPSGSEEMQEHIKGFLKKLRRRYNSQSITLKYVYVKEIGPRHAAHVHMVANFCPHAPDVFRSCWEHGRVDIQLLSTDGEYSGIAEYFIKHAELTIKTEGKQIGKKYYPSRGLVQPVVKRIIIGRADTFRENIEEHDNYYLIKDSVLSGTTKDGYDYFSYYLHRTKSYKNEDEEGDEAG